jgi:pSer/pThr/pTyr-binding forkhead associated (FHA) protein
VAFSLKVTKGAGSGAEFPFDQTECRLGRTADNDIVVKDSGASRAHARVFQKGVRYFVEDLKSANGTKVNAAVLNGATKEVKTGDTITIGEVVFTFTSQDETILKNLTPAEVPVTGENETVLKGPPIDVTAEVPAIDPNATLLKPPREPQADPERGRMTGRRSPVKDDSETVPPSRALARGVEAELARPLDNSTAEVPIPPLRRASGPRAAEPLAPADNQTSEVPVPVRRGGAGLAKGNDEEEQELTAADKARIRRQAQKSSAGRLAYAWSQLSAPMRIVAAAVSILFVLGIGGFTVYQLVPKPKAKLAPEPNELSAGSPTIEASFGIGEGVMYERSDMKVFTFSAASATRIVGVLHYMARDISKDEVSISINGFDLGFVPPDTIDTGTRELELVLPAQQVKKNEVNQIIFDNVRNPPNDDAWRVWNLWLELIAIPDMTPEETINAVKEDLERSQKFYEQRDIGPDNLFKAWKGYREAWLKMESMPSRPEELYMNARSQQREIRTMLDKRCSMMELDVQKSLSQRKPDRKKARQTLEEMLRYFPTREHPCHSMARAELEDFGGLK